MAGELHRLDCDGPAVWVEVLRGELGPSSAGRAVLGSGVACSEAWGDVAGVRWDADVPSACVRDRGRGGGRKGMYHVDPLGRGSERGKYQQEDGSDGGGGAASG